MRRRQRVVTHLMDDHLLGQAVQGTRDWVALYLAFIDEDSARFNELAELIGPGGVRHALAYSYSMWTTVWMQHHGASDESIAELRADIETAAREEAAK